MRFVLVATAIALLAIPVAAQRRGRAPARHQSFSGPVYAAPRHYNRPPVVYGAGGYGRACAPTGYGFAPGYGRLGYNFYPGLYVDLPLETYWIRQRQDFGPEPLRSVWGP
jgi:hypothetical protein